MSTYTVNGHEFQAKDWGDAVRQYLNSPYVNTDEYRLWITVTHGNSTPRNYEYSTGRRIKKT